MIIVSKQTLILWTNGFLPILVGNDPSLVSDRWSLRERVKQKSAKDVHHSRSIFRHHRAATAHVDADVLNLHVRSVLGLE